MDENQRSMAKINIKQQKQSLEELINLRKNVKELEQNPIVQKYIEISKILKSFEKQPIGETEYDQIFYAMINVHKTHKCSHPLFVYVGTFDEDDFEYENFSFYNHYLCLECETIQKIGKSNYKNFEKNNLIIKEKCFRHPLKGFYYFEELKKYYWSFFLENDEKEAIDKAKNYAKTLNNKIKRC